jgi:hypothetical protein
MGTMHRDELERAIAWGAVYNPHWDNDPDAYVAAGVCPWGRTRRLGKLLLPDARFKAYLGVQHVDPRLGGWSGLYAPEARFFVSWFSGGQCLGLRVAPSMAAARDLLWAAWAQQQRLGAAGGARR